MPFSDFSEEDIEEYGDLIKTVCALSRMFSESSKPYMDYRLAENIFCRCFRAENLARSDCSIDARIGSFGVGIKTFASNSSQKIAEFNKDREIYRDLNYEDAVRKISELRNGRIEFTKRTYGVDSVYYHCLIRQEGTVLISECPMETVDTDSISEVKSKGNTIQFTDGIESYSFNISKSTLYKTFGCTPLKTVDIEILEDPFASLRNILTFSGTAIAQPVPEKPFVILPLFSVRNRNKIVPEKSGLNQWNAGGRKRAPDEVYIPIPSRVHKEKPDFFPPRDTVFTLRLPDGVSFLSAKVCQDGEKALMTNPNLALGQWILRKVLNVQEGQLVTYGTLETAGANAVRIEKNGDLDYSIDFTYLEHPDLW